MAQNGSKQIVDKLWDYCNVLRDAGLSYGDYVEQLTYLLFLKMANERQRMPKGQSLIPKEYNWETLIQKDGEELERHYTKTLDQLGKEKGMLGVIFRKARNKIQNPAMLRRLIVDLIGSIEWSSLSADVKGDAYEGLLEKNAQDVKSGAGQYFTPRPLIDAIVEVMQPQPGETICDPACGTGGFLLSSNRYIIKHFGKRLNQDQKKHLRLHAFQGYDIVDGVVSLCAMNLLLHGIGPTEEDKAPPVESRDSLLKKSEEYDIILTNPPFGKKSTIKISIEDNNVNRKKDDLEISRNDFWATTSNKQLNFLQHVFQSLNIGGRAAIVVPDNVLFEGGAGEKIRRKILMQGDVHTLLRLPTGLFYSQGVKANVLFFERKSASEKNWTKKVWIYDLRTNMHFTLKQNPLKQSDLDEFVKCYNPENRHKRHPIWSEKNPEGRWRDYTYEEIVQRDKCSLDIFWLRDASLDDSENMPDPEVIASEIVEDLRSALEEFELILSDLEKGSE